MGGGTERYDVVIDALCDATRRGTVDARPLRSGLRVRYCASTVCTKYIVQSQKYPSHTQ